jgi:MFS family permease
MLACLLTTLLGVREIATHDAPRVEVNQVPAEPTAVVPVWQVRSFWWLVGSRLVFLMGIYGIQAFAQYYVRDVLRPPNPAQLTGDLLAAITLALIVFAIGGGRLGDSIGHKNVLVMASAISAIGYLLLVGVRTPSTLLVFGSVLGAGIGLFLTSNWALANRLAPTVEAGKYMGLTNLATAGAGALARLGGPLIDIGNNAQPGAFIGYTGLFLFGTICAIFSAFLLRWVTLGTSPAGTQALSQSSFEDPV